MQAGSTIAGKFAGLPVNWLRNLRIAGISFIAGCIFSAYDVQPANFIVQGFQNTRDLAAELLQTRSLLLEPIRYPGSGVTTYNESASWKGLTLVQGILPGGPQVRLIDMSGKELHRWNVNFFDIWKNPAHITPAANIPKSEFNYHTQGFVAGRDGSIVVNVADKGAAKLDKCGNVVWTVDRMTHHAVTQAPDGGYWFPSNKPIDEISPAMLPPGLTREEMAKRVTGRSANPNPENTILKVDGNGNVEKEFSVLKAIFDAGLEGAIFDGRMDDQLTDPTHLNDIEIVTPALASKIDNVESGDLLVSLRNMNMIAILDQQDGHLKWRHRGPWVRQHDVDITPEGNITVFNNRQPVLRSFYTEGSQILSFDPATEKTTVLHPVTENDRFRSYILGSHQRLPNGNDLIAESLAGRVFEATPKGDVVWSYTLPFDSEYASAIEVSERVADDFFTVRNWSCGQQETS